MSGYEAVGFRIPLFEDSIWKPDPGAEVCARELCKELADISDHRLSAFIVTVLAAVQPV
jgi:hypothetical protein